MRTAVPGTEDQTRFGLRTGDRESKDGRPDEERRSEDGEPGVFGREDRMRTGHIGQEAAIAWRGGEIRSKRQHV